MSGDGRLSSRGLLGARKEVIVPSVVHDFCGIIVMTRVDPELALPENKHGIRTDSTASHFSE